MGYIVSIDQSRCIGAGNCVNIAPCAFQLDEEHIAYLVDPSAEDDETLLDAARSCPTNAIYIDDEQSNAIYP
jgi:ferredoxin